MLFGVSCSGNFTTLRSPSDASTSGHQFLLEADILHRDVSVYNIVYDMSEEPGNRGRIIDLDLAVNVEDLWANGHQRTEGDARTVRRPPLPLLLCTELIIHDVSCRAPRRTCRTSFSEEALRT